jgi:DNA-binding transcriptional ArsR family regulator
VLTPLAATTVARPSARRPARGELPSGCLAARFQHSWPTTTRHLGVLEAAGIVEVRREGRSSHYRPNREFLRQVVGGWLLALLDPTQGGMKPTPGPKSLYFATGDVEGVHARAKALDALAPFKVHGQPAGDVIERPWGEKSFYVTDPWGNELCFVQEGTLYL